MSSSDKTPVATLAMITLDCADPQASAAFWSALLGWDVAHAEEQYAMLTGPSHALGFGRVEDYEPPPWPNEAGSKQFHFDLAVDDLDAAAEAAVALGATLPEEQPGGTWRVLLDPAGHPFCLTKAENWG
jgi:catechol 2,3-dioxygenase-like lactoylglutathione lyase family enzyme